MASGHVNRANRPNTWPQPTNCTVKKTLASREPSTHGTSEINGLSRFESAVGVRLRRLASCLGPNLMGWMAPSRHRCAKVGLSKTPTDGSHP
jgi:hypothetical protein